MRKYICLLCVVVFSLSTFISYALEPGCPSERMTKVIEDRPIDTIIIHHTSKSADNETDYSARHFALYFRKLHSYKGYHYVIRKDGTIEQSKPYSVKFDTQIRGEIDDIVLQHSVGRNLTSVAIGVVGHSQFTEEQKQALENLIIGLCQSHPITSIERHSKYSPGENIDVEYLHKTFINN